MPDQEPFLVSSTEILPPPVHIKPEPVEETPNLMMTASNGDLASTVHSDAQLQQPETSIRGKPIAIKLQPTLAGYFGAELSANDSPSNSTPPSLPGTAQPDTQPPTATPSAVALQTTKTSPTGKKARKPSSKQVEKKLAKIVDQSRPNSRNFAPAYVKNAAVKERRAKQVRRAKVRLARLAQSLSSEEAAMFGLEAYRTMEVDPADGQVADQAVGRKEEDDQIEKLLMEGISEEAIIEGYLDHRLDALDSHYNAIAEQFTDYSSGLVRTSADAELHRDIEERVPDEEPPIFSTQPTL